MVITVIGGFCFFLVVFVLIRNEWVYKTRKKMIDDDFSAYKLLPSYEQMLFRFWIWNINKFL